MTTGRVSRSTRPCGGVRIAEHPENHTCATVSQRRILVFLSMTVLALASVATRAATAPATEYFTRPIRLIVGFPPGSTDDYNARVIAPKLTEINRSS